MMASYGTLIRQALSAPGDQGSNSRRIAEGVQSIDGQDIGSLGTKGSWWRRLAEAGGLISGRGGWPNRIAAAGAGSALKRILEDDTLSSGGGGGDFSLQLEVPGDDTYDLLLGDDEQLALET